MIWQENVTQIVMLTNLQEGVRVSGLTKECQIRSHQIAFIKERNKNVHLPRTIQSFFLLQLKIKQKRPFYIISLQHNRLLHYSNMH